MTTTPAAKLLDTESTQGGHGVPQFIADEASLICALEIALREEEFTRDEAVQLVCAWLQGPRADGAFQLWREGT